MRCGAETDTDGRCAPCGSAPRREGGLLDLLSPADVPAPHVNAFYEQNPFPGYAPGDDAPALLDRCRALPFARWLDEAIGPEATVLDAGCGTGQIANFLALAGRRRTVVGADACLASLRAAEGFRARAGLHTLRLLRADLFDLPLAEGAFDVVVCRGVVHHTPDPGRAIARVARHVAPGGHLVLGFYESLGRLPHRLRRGVFRLAGRPVATLDPILRRRDLDEHKKAVWIADQYHHPLERCLGLPWVVGQLSALGFRWVRSVPPALASGTLFDETPAPGRLGLLLRRLGWAADLSSEDAGLVCVVARRTQRRA